MKPILEKIAGLQKTSGTLGTALGGGAPSMVSRHHILEELMKDPDFQQLDDETKMKVINKPGFLEAVAGNVAGIGTSAGAATLLGSAAGPVGTVAGLAAGIPIKYLVTKALQQRTIDKELEKQV